MASALHESDRRFLTELNAEWRRLVESERQVVTEWAARWSCFVECHDLADCVADGRARHDVFLGALLAAAHEGTELAGRVVLQALLPAMVRMSARDATADLSDYVAAVWCRIRTYPLARRPDKIANNLELDTLKSVCRDRPTSPATPTGPDELDILWTGRDRPVTTEPDAPALIGAAVAHGLIDDFTGVVLHTVYADGLSGRAAAERHHTTVDLIRWRCSKGVRTLARNAALLAEVG